MNLAPLINQLGWTRRLEHMEPAAGFGSRIAALNGHRLRPFLSEFGINPWQIDKGFERAVRTLAHVGRADPEALLRFTPTPGAHGQLSHIAGETLYRLQVHRTFFRYCPHCVAEDLKTFDGPKASRPWLRLAWTIGHFRSCDRHGVALVPAQPVRRRYEPFDFAETIEELVEPVLDEVLSGAAATKPSPFQRWLTARLEGRRDPSNWLDAVDLHAATTFAEALGVSILHPPKVGPTTLSERDWGAAADTGFEAAAGGPEALRAVLAELNKAQAHTRGFWGLRDTYGHAYGLLEKTLKDPAYAPFREAVRNFAMTTMPIAVGTDVLGKVVETQRVQTVRSVAMASGAHARTIRRYVERMGLVGDRATSGVTDHRALLPTGEIERIARDLKGALSTPKMREEYGIDRVHLTRLIALGHLVPVTDSAERRYGKHRFTRASVEEMLGRLFEGAVDVAEATGRRVPLGDARHLANCTLDEVFDLVFNGRLAWKGLLGGRREYGALLLDADELKRIVRDKPKRQCLTRAEFCAFVPGLGRKITAQFLIDNRLVVETEEYSPDARRKIPVITMESAESFKARHVTLGEVMSARGLHHRHALAALARAGVEPLFDPGEAGCFIYERAAAGKILRA